METIRGGRRLSEFLGLKRNIIAVAGAMFLMGLGEELWKRFLPKYLDVLGTPVLAIGLTSRSLTCAHDRSGCIT